MNKTLLLVIFWAVCTTLSFGQSGTNLNRATRFAVLASTQVTNNGSTTVTGDLGISPGSTIIDNGTLTVTGTKDLGNPAAAGAMEDARTVYNNLWASPSPTPLASTIGNSTTIRPGTYKISGDAVLKGFLTLDARGDSDAKFIILVDGNFSSEANAVVLLLNGAQAQNVFWVVSGNSTVLGNSNLFHGNILAQGDITLSNAVSLTGRVISLGGAVNLNSNNVLQPIQFENNLKVEKSVAAGDYKTGDLVTYTVTATNNGPTNAVDVVIKENTPAGLELVSATPAKGTYNQTTNEWSIALLANQEVTTLTLVFRITQPGALKNTVTIASLYNDSDQTDNTASVTITATCPALPAITIAGNAEICDITQTITYTATPVANATYLFTLPQGWTLVSQQGNVAEIKVATSGTLGVTVTDQCNNTATGNLAIVVVAKPATPTINGPDLICDITQPYTYTATGISENVTYEWVAGGSFAIESGQGTASVVVRANSQTEGTLSVKAINVCGVSSDVATKTVKVSAPPAVSAIIATADNTEACQGSTVTYKVTGVAGETYTWRLEGGLVLADGSDLTGDEISVVANGAGSVFVKATNDCGTSAEGTLAVTTITAPAAPAAITGPRSVCRESAGHVYSIDAVTGATGYTWTVPAGFTITSGQNTTSITVEATATATAGSISVVATNKCGSSAATVLPVTLDEKPTAPVITGDATACVSATPVTYAITPVTGETYAWTTSGSIAIDGSTTGVQVNVIVSGTGTLTVTATNKCGSTATDLTITPTPKLAAPASITTSITGEICEGQQVTLTAAAVTGADSYTWEVPAGIEVVSTDRTTNTLVIIASSTAVIRVAGVNKCGAGDFASTTVNVTPKPAAPSITGDLTACVNATTPVTYSVAPVAGATNYTWVATGGLTISGSNEGLEVSVLVNGTGTLTATSLTNTCAGGSTTITVTPTDKPAAPGAITGPAAVCRASTGNTYSVPAVAGVTYKWAVPAGFTITAGQGTASITVDATTTATAGNITVVANNKCGDSEASTFAVTINEKPTAPVITGDATACVSTTPVVFSITGVTGETYAWTTSGDIAIDGAATGTQVNVVVSGAGTLTVTATNTCGSTPAGINIVPTPKLAAPANLRSNATGEVCEGQQLVLTADAVAGADSYTWTVPTGWTVVSTDRTTTTLTVIATSTGTVSVAANNKCGAGTAATLPVDVTPKPAAPAAITGDLTACVDATTPVTYSIAAVTSATSYNWVASGDLEIVGSTTGLQVAVLVKGAGTLTVTSMNNTCAGGATSITITPSVIPAAPAAITGPGSVCRASAGHVYSIAAVIGATGYTWTVPAGFTITSGQNTTSITVEATATATAGNISVVATNKCGSSAATVLPVTLDEKPTAPTSLRSNATGQICQGQRVTFNVDAVAGATSYTWTLPTGWTADPASTTTQLVAIAGATGNVTVVANNKCGASEPVSMNVTVTPTPAAPVFTSTNATPCINTSVTYSVAPVAGVTNVWSLTGNYTVGGDGDLTGDAITVTLNGPVTLSVTGANGACAGTATTLTVNPTTAPATPGAITGPAEVCANSTGIVFSVAEVAGATAYNWVLPAGWVITAGAGTKSITVTANATAGNVVVGVTNACFTTPIQSAPKAVTISTPPATIAAITDNSTLCEGLSYSVATTAGATTYNWTVPAGFTITAGQGTTAIKVRRDNNTATGNVTVTPSNAGGCAGAATVLAIDTEVLNDVLEFPKAFSPNGDGNNDTWVIANLEKFSQNEVTIFNRWGSEVYKTKNYQNNWTANGLEKGTYFYKVSVKLCDGVTKNFTGYTTVFR